MKCRGNPGGDPIGIKLRTAELGGGGVRGVVRAEGKPKERESESLVVE
jgi:hypothetical protein